MLKYNFLLYLLSPLIFLKLLFYTLKNKENLGYLLKKTVKTKVSKKYNIWLHAASVGEMKIAIKITKCLKEKGFNNILITSNTPSSKHILYHKFKRIEKIYKDRFGDGIFDNCLDGDKRYLDVDYRKNNNI